MKSPYRYLFGPVPSRRFGRSLGIDLTPYKTCSQNCIFCQLGHTTHLTVERRAYVPIEDVLSELMDFFTSGDTADYITLSGSGEPTLHPDFGRVLETIRGETQTPALLLTNGSLLQRPEVRAAAAGATVVKASLSAWDQESFKRINRPHPSLDFDGVIAGYNAFRKQFAGELRLEVFLMKGINTAPEQVEKMAALANKIHADHIQFNTVDRPPAVSSVQPVPMEEMVPLKNLFAPPAEIVSEQSIHPSSVNRGTSEAILAMINRRPCTAKQIAGSFATNINEVVKHLAQLYRAGKIRVETTNNRAFYIGKSGS